MPVWWVEQTEGPHISEIKSVAAGYKAGTVEPKTAYRKLVEMYRQTHDGQEPGLSWEEVEARGAWDVDHYITVHFPFYANHWFSGRPKVCEAVCHRLERQHPSAKFAVGYEY